MYVKSILYIIGVSLAVPLFLNSLSENRSIKIIRENDFEENKLIIEDTSLETFNKKNDQYSRSYTEILKPIQENTLINFNEDSKDIMFVSTLGNLKIKIFFCFLGFFFKNFILNIIY